MQWWGEEVVVADGEAEELEVAPGSYFETGRVEPVNMASGEMVTRLDGPSEHLFGSIDDIPAPECSEYPSSWLDALSDLAFSPGGALIAGGGWAHALVVWDAVSGEIVHTQVDEEIFPFEDVRVAFSPDGAFLAYSAEGKPPTRGRLSVSGVRCPRRRPSRMCQGFGHPTDHSFSMATTSLRSPSSTHPPGRKKNHWPASRATSWRTYISARTVNS